MQETTCFTALLVNYSGWLAIHLLPWTKSCFTRFTPANDIVHGLRTPREEIAFTARPKTPSQSQIFRYGGSIFSLPHRPNFSDVFDLCCHWVSVVRNPSKLFLFFLLISCLCDSQENQKLEMVPNQRNSGINPAMVYSCIFWMRSQKF